MARFILIGVVFGLIQIQIDVFAEVSSFRDCDITDDGRYVCIADATGRYTFVTKEIYNQVNVAAGATSTHAEKNAESPNLEKTYEKETKRQLTPAQTARRKHREERMLGAGKEGKIALQDEMRELKLKQEKEKLKESNERREANEGRLKLEKEMSEIKRAQEEARKKRKLQESNERREAEGRRLKLEKGEPAKTPSAGNAKNSSLKSRGLPEVETVQLALRARGLYDDDIDGLMGKNTAEGIKQWQRRRHLTVTGKLRRSENQRIELICGVFPQEGNCGKEYKPEPDKSSFFSRQWTLALFVALLTGWLADWLGLISAVLSVACVILTILSYPTADKRFSSGYKDNASPPGCGMVFYPAIVAIVFWGYAWGVGALCWEGFVAGNIDCNYCKIGTIGYDGVVKSYPRGFLPASLSDSF